MTERLYTIGEVADALDRVPHTIRIWMYQNRLPKELLPQRDERNWRYWTEEQLEGLKEWVIIQDMRPGKGLQTVQANKG
jgi:DNA-binding transcriptional MerR regulator